ncbi:MAG: glutamine--tRNA ligase/YqeY domain fusion protein [Methylophagaceae bacterium]|jgi:glutaminyl-tRNA synthetase|tara:strand:- start:2264 stop:3946 length:1683 start_codon:yes stop_codon:yes gene_type:complete
MNEIADTKPSNFIRHIIDSDMTANKYGGHFQTRFPPEPNGYLHIGHAKSICLNFGLAMDYKGLCTLRFDDTNPQKEEEEFVDAIKTDVHWLGFEFEKHLHYASSYFEKLYAYAVQLIEQGDAYVCDLSAEETREYRGTLTTPGKDSPYRERSIKENLDLFKRMRDGEFEDGSRLLRAKVDMASANINLRDPAIYRIRRDVVHHQTGTAWSIYPMYDYAHCLSDAIEGVTHSLCTLEFEDHRPLYDWFLNTIKTEHHPKQIEFSRLNLQYTITSKRKLTKLVEGNFVNGWNDPRMPTITGMRRRGYPAEALREFCLRIGVTKADNSVEMGILESCVRENLNENSPRAMAVLDPLKVVISNYPEDKTEQLIAPNHPQNESMGTREVPFSKTLYIDKSDFKEEANNKFKRLVKDKEVRLRNAYVIRCDEVIKDELGEVVELRCSYDPATLGVNPEDRKVKGVIHWVSAKHGIPLEIRVFDRLFNHPHPDMDKDVDDFTVHLNPDSLITLTQSIVEPSVALAASNLVYQFEREGYFCADSELSASGNLVFNRTITLRDTWVKTS